MEPNLQALISSKTRVRLLTRLFLNPTARAYLRELAKEFNVSTNSVREELNQLTNAKLLKKEKNGRTIYYCANQEHPLFPELNSMVKKVLGIDQVLDSIIKRLGNLEKAYVIDDYAEGKDTGIIDLVFVGEIDQHQINHLSKPLEQYLQKKLRILVLSLQESEDLEPKILQRPHFLLWPTISGSIDTQSKTCEFWRK